MAKSGGARPDDDAIGPDGPMLRHSLQEHHGRSLMKIPDRPADRPDPDRLEWRYAAFRAA